MPVRWLAITALVALGPVPARAADPLTAADDLVRPFLEGKKNLGLVVGVVTPDGRSVAGYGTVRLGPAVVVPDGDTVFELGSVTKAYTGVLLAVLERDGVVKLDDSARKHLPPELRLPRRGERPITLLDLTTHYSGLPVQPPLIGLRALLSGDRDNPYAHYDRAKLAADLANLRLKHAPGECYAYSNLGAGLLGHALAHAAKADSYEAALVRYVLDPLRLADTRITLSPAQRRRFPPGHDGDGDEVSHWDLASLEACGALRSTAHDQLTFLAANLGLTPTPLLPALRASHAPRRDTDLPGQKVALGWHVQPLRRGGKATLVWHNGGTGGSRCFLGFVPEARVGAVILNNSDHSVDALTIELLRRLSPAE
jgi:D-alanyl-D-alanine-carboxypeptidase/D-alanyl-D-alanine-endopeptidase